jgi:hypothetical protein
MLFGETVAVYCENHTDHINTLCGHFSSYLTGNTLRLRYKAQQVNAVWGYTRCGYNSETNVTKHCVITVNAEHKRHKEVKRSQETLRNSSLALAMSLTSPPVGTTFLRRPSPRGFLSLSKVQQTTLFFSF